MKIDPNPLVAINNAREDAFQELQRQLRVPAAPAEDLGIAEKVKDWPKELRERFEQLTRGLH